MPETTTYTETASAYAEDREAQFLELAAELDGGEDDPGEAGTVGDDAGRSPATADPTVPADGSADDPAGDAGPATARPAATGDDAPDSSATDPLAAVLATAGPFTYKQDGQTYTLDGIREIPGGRAVVDAAFLPTLKDIIQGGRRAVETNRGLYQKVQEYEAFEVKDGQGRAHRGSAAVEHLVAENAKLVDTVTLLAGVLENPDKIAALLTDPREMPLLTREVALTARTAEGRARSQYSETRQRGAQAATQGAEQATVRQHAISGAIQHWSAQFPALTPDDLTAAEQHFGRVATAVVRPATPEEAQQAGVKPGQLVIDHPVVFDWLKDRAALRAQHAESTKKAQGAAATNAARLNATTKGGGKPATAGKGKPAVAPNDTTRPLTKDEQWQRQKNRMLSGKYESDGDSDE